MIIFVSLCLSRAKTTRKSIFQTISTCPILTNIDLKQNVTLKIFSEKYLEIENTPFFSKPLFLSEPQF